jgi:Na+/proline symporter
MNFEELQKTWQAQDAGTKVTIDADVLLKEVRRNERQFRATIFWRDAREVGVAFLLILWFLYCGLRDHDWTDFLVGSACFGVAAYMVTDRLLQRRKQAAANDSLKACAERSLVQVNHQIWLLRNVFWWYLLPFAAALGISIGYSTWQARHFGTTAVIGWCLLALFGVLLYWGIYWLNQFAVRKDLEPRRQELEGLVASLK